MFYSVASPDWKPGQPLTPAGSLLFRSQVEAASFAPDAVVVAVSVRYDSANRSVRPCGQAEPWSARAVGNMLGGITVFGVIPAALVRVLGPDKTAFAAPSEPVANGFHGWDSLTMALLA